MHRPHGNIRSIAVAVIAALTLSVSACGGGGSSDALVSIGAGLKGPKGTTATVYARGMKNVAALAFDAGGRLWAATASYTDDGTDQLYEIAKSGAKPVKVVTGLHGPLGLLWYRGSLYVASKGRVETYTGFDGVTFGHHATLLTLPSGVGESNQMVLAPNGRIVLGISAACDHCVPKTPWSGSIVSFKPDGTDLQIYAERIRAAVGLVYYPDTNDLFVSMNQRDDLGSKTPGDWLSVVRKGDDWRFPACYGQSGSVCASVPKPVAELDKHSTVSGVAIVTGQLGSTVGTTALVAEWAAGKVQRVALVKSGSKYTGSVHTFLTGVKSPVPVIVTGNGSVLVGDWATGIVYTITKA